MKILKIRFNHLNSLSTRDPNGFTIDLSQSPFKESGIFAITGLNGAGKSTILDAITMALFRKSARFGDEKNPEKMISYGQKECWAEVVMEKNNQVYEFRSELQINKKGECKSNVRLNNISESLVIADAIKPFEQLVEHEFIGLNYDQFLKTILLAQGNFTAFLDAPTHEKAEILSKITNGEVYKQLSINCHLTHKSKEEGERLLKTELELISVFSEEELQEKINRMTLLHQQIILQTAQEMELSQQLHWLANLETAFLEYEEKDKSHQIARQKLILHHPEAEKLARHTDALTLQPILAVWDDLQKQVQNIRGILLIKSEEQASLNELRKAADLHYTQARLLDESLKQQWKDFEPKLRQAERIEERINVSEPKLKNLRQQHKSINEKIEIEKNNYRKTEAELQEFSQKLNELNKYLVDHSIDGQLKNDLSGIQQASKLFDERKKTLANLQKETKLALKSKNVTEAQSADFIKSRTQELESNLNQHKTASLHLLAGNNLEEWGRMIEQTRQDLLQLERLFTYLSNQEDELNNQKQLQLQLKSLEDQRLELMEETTSLENQIATTDQLLKSSYQKLRWEQENASMSEKRNTLTDGEPCPLCGSIHHPFVDDNDQLQHSDSEKQIKTAENQQKIAQDRLNQANKKQGETQGLIQQLQSNISDSIQKSQVWLAQAHDINPNITTPVECQQEQVILKEKLELWLIPYQEYQNHQTIIQQITEELLSHQQVINLFNRCEDAQNELQASKSAVERLLAPYHINFNPDQPTDQWMKILQTRSSEFLKAETEVRKVDVFIRDKENRLNKNEAELTALNRELEFITAQGKELKEQIEKDKQQKQDLVGPLNCFDIQDQWNFRVQQVHAQAQESEQLYQAIVLELGQKSAELETLTFTLNELSNHLREKDMELRTELINFNIPNPETLKSYYLSPTEAKNIRQVQERLIQTEKTLDASRQEALEKWEKIKNEAKTNEVSSVLQDQLTQIRDSLDRIQQEIGSINTQLEQNIDNVQNKFQKMDEYEIVLAERQRWQQLNYLIGSHDGKKFQMIAQKFTLSRLVEAANYHLVQLSKRYRIVSKQSVELKDLELEIEDLSQASNRRPTKGLSGGEKFLISLALALGLSDLAGSKARIENLFIDEGFGTLDAQNLELALSVLDSLQSQGKLIGIISHIPSLNDRIPARIHVQKQGGGFSTITTE